MVYISQMDMRNDSMFKINAFRGLNSIDTATALDDNESPDMRNMFLDERKCLRKRYGYERMFPTALGTGKINGIFQYQQLNNPNPFFIMAYGTKLYTVNTTVKTLAPTQIYDGLADTQVTFFQMNNKCYIMDGTHYLVYDGTTVSPVIPYIPTIMMSTNPATSVGEPFEDVNFLTKYFKQSFSGDNTTKIYQLALTGLDAALPTITIDNVATTAFTYNAALGQVTFTNAPTKGTNNVVIQASKTGIDNPSIIMGCRFAMAFGGTNDSRIFVSGNPLYPNFMYRSGLYDPTYFEENGFYRVGTPDDPITGFARQYSYLIVFKQQSIYNVEYDISDSTGVATFPIKMINDSVGCYAKNSIQIIDNAPVFMDRNGVYSLNQTNLKDERNVEILSTRIENLLLFEKNLQNAVAIDYDQKYYLAVNGLIFVFDYRQSEWFVFDDFPVDCFLEFNRNLYFGYQGMIYRYMDDGSNPSPYNDDGRPIAAYWRSKIMSFGSDEELKFVKKVFYSIMPSTDTSAQLWYTTNKKNRKFFKESTYKTVGYNTWNYTTFTYGSVNFPQESSNKVKQKKIIYFQIELRNEKLNEGLNILSVGIQYIYQRYIK